VRASVAGGGGGGVYRGFAAAKASAGARSPLAHIRCARNVVSRINAARRTDHALVGVGRRGIDFVIVRPQLPVPLQL